MSKNTTHAPNSIAGDGAHMVNIGQGGDGYWKPSTSAVSNVVKVVVVIAKDFERRTVEEALTEFFSDDWEEVASSPMNDRSPIVIRGKVRAKTVEITFERLVDMGKTGVDKLVLGKWQNRFQYVTMIGCCAGIPRAFPTAEKKADHEIAEKKADHIIAEKKSDTMEGKALGDGPSLKEESRGIETERGSKHPKTMSASIYRSPNIGKVIPFVDSIGVTLQVNSDGAVVLSSLKELCSGTSPESVNLHLQGLKDSLETTYGVRLADPKIPRKVISVTGSRACEFRQEELESLLVHYNADGLEMEIAFLWEKIRLHNQQVEASKRIHLLPAFKAVSDDGVDDPRRE